MSRQNHNKRLVYQEFGNSEVPEMETITDLPPTQQNLRVQASRSGRKGKTVTTITGFQTSSETLQKLLKQLKSQCGSGGTIKEQSIEIQGNHCQKIQETLSKLGYKVKISGG